MQPFMVARNSDIEKEAAHILITSTQLLVFSNALEVQM